MRYEFLVEIYATERIKVLSVWSEFRDEDLPLRPRHDDSRGRSVLEQMVHQCVSEDTWFRNMLGIDVGAPPLPQPETRIAFITRYAEDSASLLAVLRHTEDRWWEEQTRFFDVQRSRAWVMTRRLTHTAHHRGQQMAMLRMLGRDLHSNYGPTADTGGLMQSHAPTIYAYRNVEALLEAEGRGGAKSPLPGALGNAVTERPAPDGATQTPSATTATRPARSHDAGMHEFWLSGPVEGVPPPLLPAAHTFLQVQHDVTTAVGDLSTEQIWKRVGQSASVGFHAVHIAGATDRLLTYARGEPLDKAQIAAMRAEPATSGLDAQALITRVQQAMDAALAQVRATPADTLTLPRHVGRKQLPTTTLGAITHAAEHALRHAGQIATLRKVLA